MLYMPNPDKNSASNGLISGHEVLRKCSNFFQEDFKLRLVLVWFDFCFTALQHILGHFGHGQLT